MNCVVPFAMEFVRIQVDMSELFIRDLSSNGVLAVIQAAALGAPPAADGSHSECARVVVRAYIDEPGVASQVIDAVGDRRGAPR